MTSGVLVLSQALKGYYLESLGGGHAKTFEEPEVLAILAHQLGHWHFAHKPRRALLHQVCSFEHWRKNNTQGFCRWLLMKYSETPIIQIDFPGKKDSEEGLECDYSPLLIVIPILLSFLEGKSQQSTLPTSGQPLSCNLQ
jgi:hypothetical protein